MADTAEIMRQFNTAFVEHNPALLTALVGADRVMETIQPARTAPASRAGTRV